MAKSFEAVELYTGPSMSSGDSAASRCGLRRRGHRRFLEIQQWKLPRCDGVVAYYGLASDLGCR